MNRVEARQISAEIYTAFLAETPHSRFHELSWLNVIAGVYEIEIFPLGFYQDDTLIAVSPILRRRIGPISLWGGPLRKCAVPAATAFCSPSAEAGRVLHALRVWFERQKIGFLQVTVPSSIDLAPVAAKRIEELDNLELSLAPPLQSIWQRLSQSPRYEVRKAFRAGVRVHWCHGQGILNNLPQMLNDTYGRQGAGTRPTYSEGLYAALLRAKESVGLKVLCAKYRGRVIAALWVFTDAERCYYWDALSLTSARKLSANHLLVWCLIRWAHHRGHEVFDFVGAGLGRDRTRPGIGRFKQSMGATPVRYNICYWYRPWHGLLLRAYRFFQTTKKTLRERCRNA